MLAGILFGVGMFAFAEGDSKRMAIGAVNFWLLPYAGARISMSDLFCEGWANFEGVRAYTPPSS